MKVKLKELIGTKWHPVEAERLVGNSICNFMVDGATPMVAALTKGKETIAIVSNNEGYVDLYSKKHFAISAKNLQILMGTDTIPPVVAQIFPEAGVVQIKTIKERL